MNTLARLIGPAVVFGVLPAMSYVAGRLWDSEPTLILFPVFASLFLIYVTITNQPEAKGNSRDANHS